MRKYLIYLMMAAAIMTFGACSPDNEKEPDTPDKENPDEPGENTGIPFCTYAATYRDETLARIVELTPDADHLTGEGLTSGRINTEATEAWLRNIGVVE